MAHSLTDIYSGLVSAERAQMEKAAASARSATSGDDMIKVASAYDQIGRAMAREFVNDMIKAAQEEAPPEMIEGAPEGAVDEPEEEELARRKAEILAQLQAEGDDGSMPPEGGMPPEVDPAAAPPV
jgi:hypothetical protein